MDPAWREQAAGLLDVWSRAVRASSAVENWHSIVRPHLAVHRSLSAGLLARLSVWHNHRVAPRGLHQGRSQMPRSGQVKEANDFLVALGYPPVHATEHSTVLKNEWIVAESLSCVQFILAQSVGTHVCHDLLGEDGSKDVLFSHLFFCNA